MAHPYRPRLVGLTVIGAILATALLAPSFETAPAGPPGDIETDAFLGLINQYRQQNRLRPLQIEPPLQAAADWMADDMLNTSKCVATGTCTHVDSLGRDFPDRFLAFGYTAGYSS